jgi:hypothetical protein
MATLDMNDPEDVVTGLLHRNELLKMTGEFLDTLIETADSERQLNGAEEALSSLVTNLRKFRSALTEGGF